MRTSCGCPILATGLIDEIGAESSNPLAVSQGLPVGMMLVGRTGEDATVLQVADAFQRQVYSPTFPA